jgi:oligopeptide/dipeptide ABC transporter ATP-binding protein
VDGVSFELKSRALVIVGESGCGKTSLARAILRLLPRNVHTYTGRVFLNGVDVMELSEERFQQEVRWTKIALVPQAAMNSLNPVIKVGDQVAEPLIMRGMEKENALKRVRDASELVGLPLDFLNRYPFELSGGMRQRAIIAMALAAKPTLIILDEPTSALDVLTQANIMNVLKRIKSEVNFILITHDIAISSELADEAAVMYAGQVVELCKAGDFYNKPLHPYSNKLMASVPTLHGEKKLDFIPGQPPSLINPPKGCRFAPRCSLRFERCKEEPPLVEAEEGHFVKCWLNA